MQKNKVICNEVSRITDQKYSLEKDGMFYLSVDFCVLYFKKEHPSAEKMVCPGYCILALVEAVRSKGRSLSF